MTTIEQFEEIEQLEDQLKPCPFCGCESVKLRNDERFWWAECVGCTARGPLAYNLRIATSAWNRRKS